jgi:hypothetical protein
LVNTSSNVAGERIAARNREEIARCDYLLAVFHQIGLDTAWEIGYAKGLVKPCFLLCDELGICQAKRSVMPYFSANRIISLPTWDVPAEVIAREIDAAIKGHLTNLATAE